MGKQKLSILVAMHSGNLSGVETYAEQVAATGAAASHIMTLVALGGETPAGLEARLASKGVRVVRTEPLPRAAWRSTARAIPTFAVAELSQRLDSVLWALGERFDVAHLNHPALARAARSHVDRVVVGGWFYPHSPSGRVVETWRHTGAVFPKSAAFAIKGLSHYWNDRQGYASCDCVVAPTELFAEQLEASGVHAIACPPPGRQLELRADLHLGDSSAADRARRITICCGDLSHPRKNVAAGIRAVGLMSGAYRQVDLELIGRNAEALARTLQTLPANVNVIAAGQVGREEVDDRLGRTDVLLLPSLYEEWGYVATEAALSGTPVVAFPVYPFVETLTAALGFCARDMSPEALAVALMRCLESDVSRELVASTAKAKFGAEAVGERLGEIWSGAAKREKAVVAAGRRG